MIRLSFKLPIQIFTLSTLISTSVFAEQIVVQTTEDTLDACSLRMAIEAANDAIAPGLEGDLVVGISNDVINPCDIDEETGEEGIYEIVLSEGVYNLEIFPSQEDNSAGDFFIIAPVIISGASQETTILDGSFDAELGQLDDSHDRLFTIENNAGSSLTLENLTLRNGRPANFIGEIGNSDGGAILNFGGTLVANDVTFLNNSSGIYEEVGEDPGNPQLRSGYGGAIHSLNGINAISSCMFMGNDTLHDNIQVDSPGVGGAISLDGNVGTSLIRRTLFRNNQGGESGGAIFASWNYRIEDSLFEGNSSTTYGGAVYHLQNGTTGTIVNSTFRLNQVTQGFGGALQVFAGTVDVIHSTVVENDSIALYAATGLINVQNSIVAGNIHNANPGDCGVNGNNGGNIVSLGHNLVGATGGCPSQAEGDLQVSSVDDLSESDVLFLNVIEPFDEDLGVYLLKNTDNELTAVDTGECLNDVTEDALENPKPNAGSLLCDIGAVEYTSPTIIDRSIIEPGDLCEHGGTTIVTAVDINENDMIDDDEIVSTQHLCNGAPGADGAQGEPGADGQDGADGFSTLISITPVLAGHEACSNGGQRIDVGLDNGEGDLAHNGVLDQSEIDSTEYICNGIDGEQGPQGEPGIDGEDGAQGPQGEPGIDGEDGAQGPQGEPGIDGEDGAQGPQGGPGTDGEDGAQGPQGEPGTDGEDGKNALIQVEEEPQGDNCVVSGHRVNTGIDTNSDGELSEDEITSTVYLCTPESSEATAVSEGCSVGKTSTMNGYWAIALLFLVAMRRRAEKIS